MVYTVMVKKIFWLILDKYYYFMGKKCHLMVCSK